MAEAAPSSQEDQKEANLEKLTGPLYEFGGKLLTQLNKEDARQNVVASPVSVHQALNMVLLGSDTNSETRREILDVIGYGTFNESELEQCNTDYANLMGEFEEITKSTMKEREEYKKREADEQAGYRDSPPNSPIIDLFTMMVTKNRAKVNPNYEQNITKYYHASISNIDESKPETEKALLDKMNAWSKEAGFEEPVLTADYLKEQFEALLISAIRLEALWFEEFEEGESDKVFYNYGSRDEPVKGKYLYMNELRGSRLIEFTTRERATAKMMHDYFSKDETFNQLTDLDFRGIDLGVHGDVSFTILEPLTCCNLSMAPMEKLNRLAESLFAKFDNKTTDKRSPPPSKLEKVLQLLDRKLDGNNLDYLRMPKFKFESQINMKPTLKSMGLIRAFNKMTAQISNMVLDKVHVEDIRHKAMIEVTKTGIKAAGVTMVRMALLSAFLKEERLRVTVENPFIFIIRYKRVPMFVGKLTNM